MTAVTGGCTRCGSKHTETIDGVNGRRCGDCPPGFDATHYDGRIRDGFDLAPYLRTVAPGGYRPDFTEHLVVEMSRADAAFAYLRMSLAREADLRFARVTVSLLLSAASSPADATAAVLSGAGRPPAPVSQLVAPRGPAVGRTRTGRHRPADRGPLGTPASCCRPQRTSGAGSHPARRGPGTGQPAAPAGRRRSGSAGCATFRSTHGLPWAQPDTPRRRGLGHWPSSENGSGTSVHRGRHVRDLVGGPLHCLGTTRDGHPRHPLYFRADAQLVPWPECLS